MKILPAVFAISVALVAAQEANAQIPGAKEPSGTGPLPIEATAPLQGVPIGTVLPYIGPLDVLPTEWLPCDGRIVNDSESPLRGVQLPNLSDNRFLMGVEGPEFVGLSAGSNLIPRARPHSHSGSTSGRTRELSGTPRRLVNAGDKSLQHTHQVEIQSAGDHNHGGENRPQFYGVRFIVRVK